MASGLTVRSARQTYGLVAVAVVALLLVGLVVPLVFGDPESSIIASSGASGRASSGNSSAPATTPTTGPVPTTALAAGRGESSAEGPGNADGEGLGATSGAPLSASDVGVTASTIKVGVVLLDLEAVEPLGLGLENYAVDTQRRVFQAYLDDINARGGINGRQVEAVYIRNDPLDAGAARSRCVELAKDHQVFAVLGFVTEETSCLVEEQRRPTIGYTNYPSSLYTNSGFYLVTGQPTSERIAADWAGAFHDLGTLQGRTIGILATEAEFEARPADSLEATLQQLGYEVAYRARLSADAETGQSQLPIEVQRMRQAGVDTVMLSTNFLAARTWVENAESQGWAPQYLTSDLGSLTADDLVERMPDSFDGALGVYNTAGGGGARSIRYGESERSENTACRELFNRVDDGHDYAYNEQSPIGNVCPMVQIFERATAAAGAELTRDGFAAAVQSLGSIPLPTYRGTFAPGKTDYNDTIRPIQWKASCRCYDITGPLMTARR